MGNPLKVSFWRCQQSVEISNITAAIFFFFVFYSPAATPEPNRQVSGDMLTLRSVTTANTAVYQCNASNQFGYLFANALVNVLRKLSLSHPCNLQCKTVMTQPQGF